MRDGFGHLHGDRHDIKLGVDRPGIRALMARYFIFWNESVHYPAFVAFPWVCRAPHDGTPCPFQEAGVLESRQGAHDRGGIAGDNPGGSLPQCAFIARLRYERMPGHLVLLAALYDELHSPRTVMLGILRSDRLRSAVDHHVGLVQEVVERAGHVQARPLHGFAAILERRKEPESLPKSRPHPPVCLDVGDADKFHVVLARNGVSDSLADYTVTVQRDPDLSLL